MRALLSALLLLLICLGIYSCGTDSDGNPETWFKKGELDLSNWVFERQGPLNLKGEWNFYWKVLATDGKQLSPEGLELLEGKRKPDRFSVINANWTESEFPGLNMTGQGYATYLLRIKLNEEERAKQLAISTRSPATAYRFWALYEDGRLIRLSQAGRVSKMPANGKPVQLKDIATFDTKGLRWLMMEISNHHKARGAATSIAPRIGPVRLIYQEVNRSRSQEFLVIGILMMVGLYHLVWFFLRKKSYTSLLLSLFSLVAVLRIFVVGRFFQTDNPENNLFDLLERLEYITLPFLTILALFYTTSLFNKIFLKRFFWAIVVYNVLTSIFIIFAPIILMSESLIAIQMGIVPFFIWSFILFGHYLLKGNKEEKNISHIVAFLIGINIFATIHDILIAHGSIFGTYISPLGQLTLFLGQTFIVARQNSQSQEISEDLTRELEAKNEKLKQMDQLKDNFLANTSHELLTPLNGIIGITESLLEGATGSLSQETNLNLRLVSSSGRRLSSLVNDLLDFSRLQYGDIVLRKNSVDINSVIEKVLALSRPLIGERDIKLFFERKILPALPADQNRLEQILFNLVGNALKFTDEGTISVTARIQQENQMMEISVADTGIGIQTEKQEMIFDAFTQEDGSISREHAGAGLGLSISKYLVELHGGNIRVESNLNIGSRFIFTLPMNVAEAEISVTNPREQPIFSADITQDISPAAPLLSGTAPRILIVDDDPVNLQLLKNHLALQNYEVIEARNGQAALKSFEEKGKIDLVLLDVMMPGLSGYEVCRIIRQTNSATDLPVMMLTAKNQVSDIVTGLDSGANDYLIKPFDPRELLARIRKMLELKNAVNSEVVADAPSTESVDKTGYRQSLVPTSIPVGEKYKITVRNISRTNESLVYYDFLDQEGNLGIFLSRASRTSDSHLPLAMAKVSFRFQKNNLNSPALLLAGMNESLYENIDKNYILSSYVFLDLEKQILTTANSSFPPLLLSRNKGQEIITLRPDGGPLGAAYNQTFSEAQTALSSGDRILIFNKGPEAEQGKESLQFLLDFIERSGELNSESFAERLINEISSRQDSGATDVVLIIVDVY